MPWKKRPKHRDILIVDVPYALKKDAEKKIHDQIVKELKTGVICCLPVGARTEVISGNLKVQIESEDIDNE